MKEERPIGITVFSILSWVWMGFALFSMIAEVSNGPLSDEDLREQEITIIESQTPEGVELMPGIVDEMIAVLKITQEQFVTLNLVGFAHIFLGIIAVILMFRLKKIGFHLYIVYSLAAVLYWTYFFGHLSIGAYLVGFTAVSSGIFVLLYGIHLKYMKS